MDAARPRIDARINRALVNGRAGEHPARYALVPDDWTAARRLGWIRSGEGKRPPTIGGVPAYPAFKAERSHLWRWSRGRLIADPL